MRDIAEKYENEDRKMYLNAASRFRLPFWDPFMPRNPIQMPLDTVFGVPKILRAKKVFIKHWDKSKPATIPNPLETFFFPQESTLKTKGRTLWTTDEYDDWMIREKDQLVERVNSRGRKHTVRTPDQDGDSNYEGRQDGLNVAIQRQAQSQSAKLWKLLSRHEWHKSEMKKRYQAGWDDDAHKNKLRSWEEFATHYVDGDTEKRKSQRDSAISLESWHDAIHGLVGTGRSPGHMGDPAIAAFDPIFWLHHCNIDRIFAIYQALYPDESDGPDEPNDPTKWLPESGKINSQTSLYPFRKSANAFWTSIDVKDWTMLGFAVPGREKLDKDGREQLEIYLRQNYYWATESDVPPNSLTSKWPRKLDHSFALHGEKAKTIDQPVLEIEALEKNKLVTRKIAVAMAETPQTEDKKLAVDFVDASGNKKLYPVGSLQSGKSHKAMRTWNAQVLVKKFAFNGSFNVHIFIGHIKDDQSERFFTKKNEVGYSGIFASDRNAPCANCLQQREDGIIYQDAIPLTMAMTKYLKSYTDAAGPEQDMRTLRSFEAEDVIPFLKQHLHWIITRTNSEVMDEINMIRESHLEISVWDRIFDLPTPEHRLGLYHPAELHPEITATQPGGLGYQYA